MSKLVERSNTGSEENWHNSSLSMTFERCYRWVIANAKIDGKGLHRFTVPVIQIVATMKTSLDVEKVNNFCLTSIKNFCCPTTD